MKLLLEDLNVQLWRRYIFKPMIGNESLHQDSTDNNVRIVNFATSKNLVVESTMFPHRNIHTCTRTSPDGKTHNQIYLMLIGDGMRIYSMHDLSGELTIILITVWCL
jgi:hypothetical protein